MHRRSIDFRSSVQAVTCIHFKTVFYTESRFLWYLQDRLAHRISVSGQIYYFDTECERKYHDYWEQSGSGSSNVLDFVIFPESDYTSDDLEGREQRGWRRKYCCRSRSVCRWRLQWGNCWNVCQHCCCQEKETCFSSLGTWACCKNWWWWWYSV